MRASQEFIKQLELLYEQYEQEVTERLKAGQLEPSAAKTHLRHSSTFVSSKKHVVEGFSESLAYELNSQNITVKLVEPGGFDSNYSAVTEQNNPSLKLPDTYNDFNKNVGELFQWLSTDKGISTIDVAQKIFEAATDGKNNSVISFQVLSNL